MKNTPFDLTGKVAIVTGSSRGIGRSSAELLAKLGAKVVVSSRKADACKEVADGINASGGDATVIPCNIARKNEVEALISGATKQYVGAEAVLKAQIAAVQADKKMPAKDKKAALADLNEALKSPPPAIENKANIDLVGKYYDKLVAALGDDQN